MGNNNKYVLRSFAALSSESCRKSNASKRSEAKYAKMKERSEEGRGKTNRILKQTADED